MKILKIISNITNGKRKSYFIADNGLPMIPDSRKIVLIISNGKNNFD